MKKTLKEILLQIIPVMIGVYLGFVVSNWSSNKQKSKQVNILVQSLENEMQSNQKRLEAVVDYHLMLRDSSRYYSDPSVALNKHRYFEGTRVITLANSAYNTGIQTGIINELPLEKIQAINQLYTFQKNYNEFGNLMMASLINKDFSEKEEDLRKIIRFLSVTMTDVVIKERDLIAGYNRMQKKLIDKE